MRKIRTPEEYVDLIKVAYDELHDLQDAVEYDEEFMGDALKLITPIREVLDKLVEEINAGRYDCGSQNTDLDYIEIIKNNPPHLLPCGPVLLKINMVHTKGFDEK